MTTKAKVTLTPEQETLLITLYAKAQPDNPLFFDPMAQDHGTTMIFWSQEMDVPRPAILVVIVAISASMLVRVIRFSVPPSL